MKQRGKLRAGLTLAVALKAVVLGFLWQGRLLDDRSAAAQDKKEDAASEREKPLVPERAGGCAQAGNLSGVLEAVAEKDKQLVRRERLLAVREAEIGRMEQDVAAKIGELEAVERKLAATLDSLEQKGRAARESLAKIYSGMKPEEAARILSGLDEDTAMKIFAGMKERNISQILPLVDRELAVALTNRLASKGATAASPDSASK